MGHTDEHRKRIAEGRVQTAAIRNYLNHLATDRRSERTPPRIQAELRTVQDAAETETDTIKRLQLVQRRMDLEAELNRSKSAPDPDDLLSRFIEAAAPYAERKGISYAAFREVGVPASVLRKAGLKS